MGKLRNEYGLFLETNDRRMAIAGDGSAGESNPISMMEIFKAEIENRVKYIEGCLQHKTTTMDNCFIGLVWRHL